MPRILGQDIGTNQALTRSVFAKVQRHKKPYRTTVGGLTITVLPGVFSPRYFTDSAWFAKKVARLAAGKRFLEIGVGTGIVALAAAKAGAKVVGTDINPSAVENTRINFLNHGLEARIIRSDVYSRLEKGQRFDVIFWNHPFNRGRSKKEPMLLRSGFDYRYRGIERYISEGHEFLAPKGKLLLGTGSIAEMERIKSIARKHGYELKLLERIIVPFENPTSRFRASIPGGQPVTYRLMIYHLRSVRAKRG
jgi:methylase of polypeptide subunit release factors